MFSGIAKFVVSNIQAYINTGPGILFRGTISGTSNASGASSFTNMSLRNNGTACIDTASGAGVNSINISDVTCIGTIGGAANGINMKGWYGSNITNVTAIGTNGSGIVISDDPSTPPGGNSVSAGLPIKSFTCIGQGQASASNGIDIGGNTYDTTIDGVYSYQCAGASGYEVNLSSASVTGIALGNLRLVPNTPGNQANNPSRAALFGANTAAQSTKPNILADCNRGAGCAGGREPALLRLDLQPLDLDGRKRDRPKRSYGDHRGCNVPCDALERELARCRDGRDGTGALVFAGGNLGAATATSINGNTFTTGTYTLTGTAGKTFVLQHAHSCWNGWFDAERRYWRHARHRRVQEYEHQRQQRAAARWRQHMERKPVRE